MFLRSSGGLAASRTFVSVNVSLMFFCRATVQPYRRLILLLDLIDVCLWQNDEEFVTKRPVLLGEGPQPHHHAPAIIPPAAG